MKAFSLPAVAICVAVVLLAGCSGGGTAPSSGFGPAAPGAAQPSLRYGKHSAAILAMVPRTHRDRRRSWRSPKLRADQSGKLLFVSDFGTDDVYVYALPKMTLMATLTGFADWPQGMCSDNAGHVWVTVAHANAIYEYDHSVSLVNTISDPYGWPANCAWDKKTGNLAVTHVSNSGGNGELLIYPNGGGSPTVYTDPDFTYYYDAAYDNHGNLFITGLNYVYFPYSDTYEIAELPKGGSSLTTLTIDGGTMYYPGGLEWDNSTQRFLAGDQECSGSFSPETSCTRSLSISGSTATITGTISLNSSAGTPACDVSQTVRMGNNLYGGDYEFAPEYGYGCTGGYSFAPSAEYRWQLPAGGDPVKSSTNTVAAPSGAAVSQ